MKSAASVASPLRFSQRPRAHRPRVLDGGWWPHSSDPGVELAGLVTAVNATRGIVTVITLHPDSWDPRPEQLSLDGRVVRLEWDPMLDPHALIATYGEGERLHLLVVPPGVRMSRAASALATASDAGNELDPSEILRRLTILPAARDAHASPSP